MTRLSDFQIRALVHVDEMTRQVEAHNARWPRDQQTAGAHGSTSSLPGPTVKRLLALGLIAEVERWPGHRFSGVYALTDAGRERLRSTHPLPRKDKHG